jgi:hypothetical protein
MSENPKDDEELPCWTRNVKLSEEEKQDDEPSE